MSADRARLSRTEWLVMNVCWRLGEATAREVHEVVGPERSWDYRTTKTVLDRIAAKGWLHVGKVGPISVFRPEVQRSEAHRHELEDFVSTVLDNSLTPLLVHLADNDRLSRGDLSRLRDLLAEDHGTDENGEAS